MVSVGGDFKDHLIPTSLHGQQSSTRPGSPEPQPRRLKLILILH